jgi:Flp pilus assembly protein TadG
MFTKLLKRWKKDDEAVAATEFALIVPILALLMIGLMDFGLYINAEMKLENMARAAAEYVIRGGDEADITTDVLSFAYMPDSVNSIDDIVVTTATECECDDGEAVACDTSCVGGTGYMRQFYHVDLELQYTTVFPYPGLPDSITLVGTARMQMQ